jgi:hypothetical protein
MGNKNIIVFYATLIACSIFIFSTVRWFSYRTPKKESDTVEYVLEHNDPRLKDVKVAKDKQYFMQEQTIVTMQAGTFPFVNKETLVIKTLMSRPSWEGL